MPLPTAIQRQLDEATAAMNEAQRPQQATAKPTSQQAPQAPSQEAQTPVTSNAEPPKLKNTGNDPAPNAEKEKDYKHMYSVIEGKYRKETADLRAELERKTRELEERSQKQAQSNQKRVDPDDITDEEIEEFFTEDQIEDFGMDLLKRLAAMNRKTANAAPESAERLERMEQQFNHQRETAFYQDLTRLVPEWAQVQDEAGWDEFLAGRDDLSDFSRGTLFAEAAENHNADRVARFFRTYLSTIQPQQGNGFDSMVSPSSYAPDGQQAKANTITFQEYMSRLNGLTGRGLSPTEIQKREQELSAMMRQGRVTGVPRSG